MLMDRRKKTLQDFEIAPQKDESITKTDFKGLGPHSCRKMGGFSDR